MHVKAIIPTRKLSLSKFQFRLLALPFELYPRKGKWLVVSIYRPLLDSLTRFPYSLAGTTDFLSISYDNFIILSDFNAHLLDSVEKDFIKAKGGKNLIK